MAVSLKIRRRIHRRLDPPLDHADLASRLRRVISPLCARPARASLCVMLCSDRVIRQLNSQWLGRDRTTNVMAFPSVLMDGITQRTGPLPPVPGVLDELLEGSGPPPHLGDVVVSVDTANREQGPGGRDGRVVYLALHGLLHVLGWDHEDDRSWRAMHRKTLELVKKTRG